MDLPAAQAYLARLAALRIGGNVEAIVRLFHDDAVLRIVGVGDPVTGKAQIREVLSELTAEFEFLEWEQIKVFVAGDEMAARHRLKMRHRPSGEVAETETCEFVTMRDGKCAAFVQYADTALVSALSQSVRL